MRYLPLIAILCLSCRQGQEAFDAQGSFEAEEVLVSPEATGRIVEWKVSEGDSLAAGDTVGRIEGRSLELQREQAEASLQALQERTTDAGPQVALLNDQLAVQQTQLDNLLRELARAEGLLRKDAATGKQVDDLRFQTESVRRQMAVTRQQVAVQRALTANQNRAVLSEAEPLRKRAAQLDDQLRRTAVVNPAGGVVIATYANIGETALPGRPLYKVADLRELTLRAYVTGDQVTGLAVGKTVTVFTDKGADAYAQHPGTISWISPRAEFTPKTIQTKDERANLVYAVKVKVRNDGTLRIGMYGEIRF
jgi:HlyD family secretion protein